MIKIESLVATPRGPSMNPCINSLSSFYLLFKHFLVCSAFFIIKHFLCWCADKKSEPQHGYGGVWWYQNQIKEILQGKKRSKHIHDQSYWKPPDSPKICITWAQNKSRWLGIKVKFSPSNQFSSVVTCMGKIKAAHLCWNFHDWESIPVEDPLNYSSNSQKSILFFICWI